MTKQSKIEQPLLIIISLILLVSGFGKLFGEGKIIGGISIFDLRMIEDGLGNWMSTSLFNRIFTAVEINLAILILTNWIKRSLLLYIFILVLGVYCVDVILGWGNLLTIHHPMLYLFNQYLTLAVIPFLVIAIISIRKKTEKRNYWFSLLVIIPVLILPFIVSPLFIEDFESKSNQYEKNESDWVIIETKFADKNIELNEGKYIVAFFSTNCTHCNQLAKILGVSTRGFNSKKKIILVFPGNEKDTREFMNRNKVDYPYIRVTPDEFTKVAGFAFPSIFSIENGKVLKQWTGDNFSLKVRDEEL